MLKSRQGMKALALRRLLSPVPEHAEVGMFGEERGSVAGRPLPWPRHGALAAEVRVGSAPEGGSPAGRCGVIQSVPVCLADTWVPVGTSLCALGRPLSFAVGREARWVGSPGRAGGCGPAPRRSSCRGVGLGTPPNAGVPLLPTG